MKTFQIEKDSIAVPLIKPWLRYVSEFQSLTVKYSLSQLDFVVIEISYIINTYNIEQLLHTFQWSGNLVSIVLLVFSVLH